METYWKALVILIAMMVLVTACGSDNDNEDDMVEPQELIQNAADNIDAAQSFRLEIRQDGPPTPLETRDLPIDEPITFNNTQAFFVGPDRVRAKVSVSIGDATQEVDVIAVEKRQYYNNALLTGSEWVKDTFAYGFRPSDLQSETEGIGNAIRSIQGLELVGNEDISGGIAVYHLRGTVTAEQVDSVTVGLMASYGSEIINADVYIRRDSSRRIQRIVLEEPSTNGGDSKFWTIDFSGYDQPYEIVEPEVE